MKLFSQSLKIVAVMFAIAVALVSCNPEDKKYTITVSDDGNGSAEADYVEAVAGTAVIITAAPDTGYMLGKWTVVSGDVALNNESANPATFIMPAGNVVIKAEFVTFDGFNFITDPTFRAYCEQFDTNTDGILSLQEAGEVTTINVQGRSILSLAGIEIFTGLTDLNCAYNSLSVLNVSKNTALTRLICSYDRISTLDVSKNTALTELYCDRNNLSTLDVSNNTALTQLVCDYTNLSTLDVSNNTALTWLNCTYNRLSTLDVSKNTALRHLNCSYTNLSALDVSRNTALTYLGCYNNNISTLDVSNNTELQDLDCHTNNLSALDVSNNTALYRLRINGNDLSDTAIKEMFASLPSRQNIGRGSVLCSSNPGWAEITAEDKKVAEDKNWWVR